ncbi:hypothetical protein [Nocardioides massiliensis]|uniref:Uncharacterized protein n=1 Tax=Nocardioides massiliensis TaxID=1325935 RepID=A0ABT9NJA9_9ACTN|nr:hypothetical protein [Nocardioides massiliensis]MDP9820508.1 hypothetical protein [Nocardioides massiliensis]
MSAETLREAAERIRSEHVVRTDSMTCQCEDWTDSWFDRSICPEPCGSMHNVCVECSLIQGGCAWDSVGRRDSNRLARSWLAVADWLDDTAGLLEATHPNPACDLRYDGNALAVARAYLGGA